MLLAGSVLAPAPAAAVDQIEIRFELITLADIAVLVNNSKRNTTFGTTITNLGVAEANNAAAANTNGGNVGNLNQLIDVTEAILFANLISITNNGEIDPAIGLFAQINNIGVAFANNAAAANTNGGAALISIGDLNQLIYVTQASLAANAIQENNSAKITADLFGIFAEINNSAFAFANSLGASNTNGGAAIVSVGDHLQLIDVEQSNELSNDINIDNRGEIDPAVGLFAGINNTLMSFANSIGAANTNGTGIAVNADALTQAIEFDQINAIRNSIAINSRAGVVAGNVGLFAEINNSFIAMANDSGTSHANGDLAVISLGDHTQSTEIYQGNLIGNEIYFTNSGDVMGGQAGLRALIRNFDIVQLRNSVGQASVSGGTALIGVGDLIQTVDAYQGNMIANDIMVMNGAKVRAQTGIDALIDNRNITFLNAVSFANLHAAAASVGDDLNQSADITQVNTVANTIGIWNSGYVKGSQIGIAAEILTSGVSFLNNVAGASTSPGTVNDQVTQTANVNQSNLIQNSISIWNSGKVWGGRIGIFASIPDPDFIALNVSNVVLDTGGTQTLTQSTQVLSSILIDNAGYVGADSLFAIDTFGASTTIFNRAGGVITGFIDLTDRPDRFFNEMGGTFEARLTSDFGGGSDLFSNVGTVHTAQTLGRSESTAFVNLDRFVNRGRISLQDGHAGDRFTISNTVGGTDLNFEASGNSNLVVDAFLGGPGSRADNFIVQGNVSGGTLLTVFNTNPLGGAFNPDGIPVVFVDGNVSPNAFFLDAPVVAGLFDYDLFFVPTGSGFFELRGHPGGGAHVLPRLTTASHDIFHTTTETWLDRTADLRVLLNGGGAPVPYAANAKYADGVAQAPGTFVPAVWMKGQGTWLDQEDTETTTSFGRTYRFDLERDLDVMNFETGIDFGKPDLLAQGDILVFGILGGAVLANLDYNNLARQFDIEGGEVGVYATYLRGGLFVDNLLKVHLLEIDPNNALGFPGSIDSTTWGARTDAGYRFGSFRRGPFIEPQATIAFSQAELDDFVLGGNRVDFSTETNVRGRLGLRVGTSYEAWPGTLVEPFVIGSLWSNLSGDHQVTLTSSGTTFRFEDEPDDVWGVISGGVNVFNPGAQTSVFAKLDVTVGEETDGLSAKAGMRYNW